MRAHFHHLHSLEDIHTGIKVVSANNTAPGVSIGAVYATGARNDPTELPGAAHFMAARAAFLNNASRSALRVVRDAQRTGAQLCVRPGREFTTFAGFSALRSSAGDVLALLADMSARPLLEGNAVDDAVDQMDDDLQALEQSEVC